MRILNCCVGDIKRILQCVRSVQLKSLKVSRWDQSKPILILEGLCKDYLFWKLFYIRLDPRKRGVEYMDQFHASQPREDSGLIWGVFGCLFTGNLQSSMSMPSFWSDIAGPEGATIESPLQLKIKLWQPKCFSLFFPEDFTLLKKVWRKTCSGEIGWGDKEDFVRLCMFSTPYRKAWYM